MHPLLLQTSLAFGNFSNCMPSPFPVGLLVLQSPMPSLLLESYILRPLECAFSCAPELLRKVSTCYHEVWTGKACRKCNSLCLIHICALENTDPGDVVTNLAPGFSVFGSAMDCSMIPFSWLSQFWMAWACHLRCPCLKVHWRWVMFIWDMNLGTALCVCVHHD